MPFDASEFRLIDNWDMLNSSLLQKPRRLSVHPGNLQVETQRHTSLNGTAGSNFSSGFASDLSSAAAFARYPSFSLTSMASVEAAETTWLNTLGVEAPSPSSAEKDESENNAGKRRNESFVNARQRSGSMAAPTASTGPQSGQHIQCSLSFSSPILSSKGNIFLQRKDFSVFQRLQAWKQNGYFIQLEDDSCTGNEDTRTFVLCQLTGHGASEVQCLACSRLLPIYDHFPLLDGALFLSALRHRGGLQVSWSVPLPPSVISITPTAGKLMQNDLVPPPGCTGPRQQQQQPSHHHHHHHQLGQQRHRALSMCQKRYLNAVCMTCMRSADCEASYHLEVVGGGSNEERSLIVCKFCHTCWNGSALLIGGLYTYDLFACSPCCVKHLRCKSCGLQPLTPRKTEKTGVDGDEKEANPLQPLPYYSQYSQLLCCQHCRAVDYHFIKPFDDVYDVRVSS